MRAARVLRSRAHVGNRVQVDAQQHFGADAALAARYRAAVAGGSRLVVQLEGDSGHGKADMLWRLAKQGYATFALPFVPWLLATDTGQALLRTGAWELLVEASWAWQRAWHLGVQEALRTTPGRPGLLVVGRSHTTSWWELSRRGLITEPPPRPMEGDAVLIHLDTDPLLVARRNSEKLFNEPQSDASRLRRGLEGPVRPDEALGGGQGRVNTTSTKQGTAALLALLGVPAPTFPQRPVQ